MQIGIVLSQPPAYSETFFTSKIKGLTMQGYSVILFVQSKAIDYDLCSVKRAPKVYRLAALQAFSTMWIFLTLIPKMIVVKRFIELERKEGTPLISIIKKIYLNAHLLKANLDWIHFGFATQALGSECVAEAIGAKMAVSFRGFDINVYPLKNKGCYEKTWKYVDKVHSISKYLYRKAISLGLSENVPHQIITPAVQMETLPVANTRTNKKIKIVTIARLHWIKGLDTAIAAVALLKRRGIEVEYHIVGEGSMKNTERYTFQVYEEGLQNEVTFHGKLSHAATLLLLSRSDIYLQPSLNEGFCNAVLEAQALGKLVLASNVGGLPENILHGVTGWLFPEGNIVALADLIESTVKMSEDTKRQIRLQAKERVLKSFTDAQQKKKFVTFYTESL